MNIPREAILSGFSPSGCAPILAALTTDQNHSEETDLGALLHQPGSRSHHRQGSDSHRAKGKLPSISRGGWGHNNSNQSPDQGVKGPSLWTNLTGQGEDNRARGARIRLSSCVNSDLSNSKFNSSCLPYAICSSVPRGLDKRIWQADTTQLLDPGVPQLSHCLQPQSHSLGREPTE